MKKIYEDIGETIYRQVMPCGLHVAIIPKADFAKKYACYAVNYGSNDACFRTADGTAVATPMGVAHFLEHKLFDNENGENALQLFAGLGASPNAFTSHIMTAYHFECSESFEENLEVLLHYVQNPYFTADSVQKEQGIIGQEIKMLEDDPDWTAFCNLLEALYEKHPIKDSIIGTTESISQITDKVLYDCYHTFYVPQNMTLCIAGDVEPDAVFALIEKNLRCEKTPRPAPVKQSYKEPAAAVTPHREAALSVEMPKYLVGFKCDDAGLGLPYLRQELLGDLSIRLLMGESSPLYKQLYDKGLINRDFQGEYMPFYGGGAILMGGESKDGKSVGAAILDHAAKVAADGFSDAYFSRVKKALMGSYLRMAESLSGLAVRQCFAHFAGYTVFDVLPCFAQITREDAEQFIKNTYVRQRFALSEIFSNQQEA